MKFGTLAGVYIPDVLQMIGVIFFLRLGWVLGHVGMPQMSVIITVSAALLLLTSLSMTAIVSNMRMRAGGAYYLISRSLGLEFGSAIGVMQHIAQLCTIALCTTGFAVSLQELVPWPLPLLQTLTLAALTLISYISTNVALKTQFLIFAAMLTSIGAIFFGFHPVSAELPMVSEHTSMLTFWMGFAIFFPAMTGIESGMALSGDLKTPSRSLPIGTIGAVLTVFALYLVFALFLSSHVEAPYLQAHPFILYHINRFPQLILLGVWTATLSSALGALIGGPRVMQAIAKDGMLPKFLARGSEPRLATLGTFLLSLFLTLCADINQIIPILCMTCLISYGLINTIACFEAFLQNPSWRPAFRIHWMVSFIGALGCFAAMFMINPGATFIALGMIVALCFWASHRNVKGNWDDMRYSVFAYLVHKGTAKLSALERNAKNWRPHILALFDSGALHKNLAFFAHAINREKGFLTFGATLTDPNSIQDLRTNLAGFKIPSHLHINRFSDPLIAADQMVRNYGFGSLKPNTILFSVPNSYAMERFAQLLIDINAQEKNIVLLKDDPQKDYLFSDPSRQAKQMDLWWRGKYPGNFELCLALAFLLQQSRLWPKSKIAIRMIAKEEESQRELFAQFDKVQKRLRIKNLEFAPILDAEGDFFSHLQKASHNADMTFLGLKRPEATTSAAEYADYCHKLLEQTSSIPNVAYVLSGEKVKFRKIFLG